MNKGRNATIDVARGFTVLIMPAVHCALTYSTLPVQKSWIGILLGFLAEGPGAELFMMLMGLSIILGRKKTIAQILKRAGVLLFIAYLLNFLKIILPLCWHGIPENVFTENNIPHNFRGELLLLMMDDILQTAAVCYLVCSLLYRLKHYWIWSVCLAIVCCFVSPLAWRIPIHPGLFEVPLNLVSGTPPAAFFPLFPWITYALAGLGIGYGIQHFESKKFYTIIFFVGLYLVIFGKTTTSFEPETWGNNFYRLGPGETLYHSGIALLWLCLCNLAVRIINATYFMQLLSWLSKHITMVYFIQWIVIFWLSPFFSYHQLGLGGTLFSIAFVTALSFGIAWVMLRTTGITGKRKTERILTNTQ